jgi:L-2-hydroxyglutarate oxidase
MMGMKHWKSGIHEFYRSMSKRAFTQALRRLVPQIQESDLVASVAGVRAQCVDRDGVLLDDFKIVAGYNSIHVLNVPSPAATASLAIGEHIVGLAANAFGL